MNVRGILTCASFLVAGSSTAATMEDFHILALSGGIAAPSMTTALGDNPAGIVYNTRTKLLADTYGPETNLDRATAGATVFAGGRVGAAGLGVAKDLGADRTSLRFGLGANVHPLGFSLGVSGRQRISGSRAGDDLDMDAGILMNPFGRLRIGVTAFGVSDEVSAVGAGFAYFLSRDVDFAFDATSDKKLDGLSVKPGLGLAFGRLQFTYGYGFQIDKIHAPSHLSLKSTVGASLEITNNVLLEFYYNQISKYYLGAVLRL